MIDGTFAEHDADCSLYRPSLSFHSHPARAGVLLLLLRIKSALAPYGVDGALPRCLRTTPQCSSTFEKGDRTASLNFIHSPLGRRKSIAFPPLPVSVVTIVTVFYIPPPLPKISTRSSPSSRLRNVQDQLNISSGVGAIAFIANMVFVPQPVRSDI